jgi:ribonuclease P protein component
MKFLQKNEPFRLAAVVPKSLARKAHVRNKLRRAVYDSFPAASSRRTGRAVFFVRTIPKEPARSVFKEEILTLLAKI